jgi:Amt family ammonium transporter
MLDCLVAGVAYWAIGWGFAYGPGGNPFCGGSNFFMYGVEFSEYPRWFFQVRQPFLIVVLNKLGHFTNKVRRSSFFCQPKKWLVQFTFAATTATIVSGSIAERCEFAAYFVYSVAITGFKKYMTLYWRFSGLLSLPPPPCDIFLLLITDF